MKESSIKVILTRPGIERQTTEMFYNDIGVLEKDWASIGEVMERNTAGEAGPGHG